MIGQLYRERGDMESRIKAWMSLLAERVGAPRTGAAAGELPRHEPPSAAGPDVDLGSGHSTIKRHAHDCATPACLAELSLGVS